MSNFYTQASIIDKYSHRNPNDHPQIISSIIEKIISDDDLRDYFFSQNPSHLWAPILQENGLFETPPDIVVEGSSYHISRWPQSKYLITIASYHPNILIDVINHCNIRNPYILVDLLEAVTHLPIEKALSIFSTINSWIDIGYLSGYGPSIEKYERLIYFFIEENKILEAFIIFEHISSPVKLVQENAPNFLSYQKVYERFHLSEIRKDIFLSLIERLEKTDHLNLIMALFKNFIISLEYEFVAQDQDVNIDHESINIRCSTWRSSIESSSQNIDRTYKTTLLNTLRDSLLNFLVKQESTIIVEWFLNQHKIILKRLGLYLLSHSRFCNSNQILQYLINVEIENNYFYHNDYFQLLKMGFPKLTKEDKEIVLTHILSGPSKEALSIAYPYEIKDISRISDLWILNRFWIIREHLIDKSKEKLNKLLLIYPEPKYPEFLSYVSEAYFVENKSPLSSSQILEMSPDEIIEYIINWIPKETYSPIEISHEGFAEVLATTFFENHNYFAGYTNKIAELPTSYISHIFNVAQKRITEINKNQLGTFIALMVSIGKIKKNKYDDRIKNKYEKVSLLHFLSNLINSQTVISLEFIDEIKNISLLFLNDTDPTEEKDNPPEGHFGHNDPISVSINSVRSLALDNLFSLYNIITTEKSSLFSNNFFHSFKNDLLLHLDRDIEPSTSVHSIYGKWLWLLFNNQQKWLSDNINKILPITDDVEYFLSAWISFLRHTIQNSDMIIFLQKYYIYAFQLIDRNITLFNHDNYFQQISAPIINDFLRNNPPLINDSSGALINYLFCSKNIKLHSDCMWTLWQITNNFTNEDKPKFFPPILKLFHWRVNEIILGGHSTTFIDEVTWLSFILINLGSYYKFADFGFSFDSLLEYSYKYTIWNNLQEFLSSKVEENPLEVINLYTKMHFQDTPPEFGKYYYNEHSNKIIEIAAKNLTSRNATLSLIDYIGRKDHRFRQIYDLYA